MPKDRIVIAVDGLAGSGKSSLSRELASKMGFMHLNSGLIYRAVAYLVARENMDPEDEPEVEALIRANTFSIGLNEKGGSDVFINGNPGGESLLSSQIGDLASKIAKHKGVRALLLPIQKDAFSGHPIVAEGRDMGTVVFPDAKVKFFVVADQLVRAQRRANQLGVDTKIAGAFEKVRADLEERDNRDQTRPDSPTVAAQDGVIIDNTSGTLTDTVMRMYNTLSDRGINPL